VLDVDNELRVIPYGVGGDAAIERPVREIIEALRVAHRGASRSVMIHRESRRKVFKLSICGYGIRIRS